MPFETFDVVSFERATSRRELRFVAELGIDFALMVGDGMDAPNVIPCGSTVRIDVELMGPYAVTSLLIRPFSY